MMRALVPQPAWLEWQGRRLAFDAAAAHSLALELDFDGRAPQWFGAPAPACTALHAGTFNGRVSGGASCNASTVSITPHCDGTHTESVGHLTREPHNARDAVPTGYVAALLLSVTPLSAIVSGETARPAPQRDDLLITQQALSAAWPRSLPFTPAALVVRTLPNSDAKRWRDYSREPAPYLSLPAAQYLVDQGIEHLVLDVPSADRADDAGQLGAHRVFFGLEPGVTALASARRPQCTITELAYVPAALVDGPWLMQVQIPALAGDALPSRPLLYRLLNA